MPAPPELKATLNLPQTDFPMKANLPQSEPKRLAAWEQDGLYEQIRGVRQDSPSYVLHDGPPYANGPIHLGHALNKCLKDFVVKSKTMAGFNAPYVPGWDCHGLPIEIKVDEKLGRKKLEMPAIAVRRACREYAEKYLNLQREQFKRLGVSWTLGPPLLHHDAGVRVKNHRDALSLPGNGLCLQGSEAGSLVHARPHGTGRSGDRIRDAHQP
jgi:isoleucyl-tRNA synthetase